MRPTACIAILCFAVLTPHIARAEPGAETDGDAPRVDMLGNPIEEPASADDAEPAPTHAADRQAPPGWPVPEIMRQAREREATRPTLAAASPGYTVPRTVTVTYTGNVPVASDVAPRIAMEVAPATSERTRVLALSVDPIGFINGHYGASIARRLNDHAALRIDGQFVRDLDGVDDSATWRLGISIPLYLNKTFQGPFIEPGLAASSQLVGIGLYPNGQSLYGVHDMAAGPQVFVGWQRLFDNGLHIAAAIGASQDWTATKYAPGVIGTVFGQPPTTALGVLSTPNAETYLRVGYAF